MRSIERRVLKAERRAIEAGFTEYDGWSEERATLEMQRLLSIAQVGGPELAERVRRSVRGCKHEEFHRVLAAKEARDAARSDAPWVAWVDSPMEEWPGDVLVAWAEVLPEDFEAAGVQLLS